jgi:hypothetical protein
MLVAMGQYHTMLERVQSHTLVHLQQKLERIWSLAQVLLTTQQMV